MGEEKYEAKKDTSSAEYVLKRYDEKHDALKPVYTLAKDVHREVFYEARKRVLGDKDDKGNTVAINEKYLDKGRDGKSAKEVQEDMIKTMLDLYQTRLEERLGSKIKKDDLFAHLNTHYKITEQTLRALIKRHKGGLTQAVYERSIIPQIDQEFDQQLYSHSSSHIDADHIEKISEHLGIKDKLNTPLDLQETYRVLQRRVDKRGERAVDLEDLIEVVGGKANTENKEKKKKDK